VTHTQIHAFYGYKKRENQWENTVFEKEKKRENHIEIRFATPLTK